MSRKISELTLASQVGTDDYSVLVQDGVTKRYKPKQAFTSELFEHTSQQDPHSQYLTKSNAAEQYATQEALNAATAVPDRYDLKSGITTGALDLAVQQVFSIDATVNRTISFSNVPGATRSMTVVIELQGKGGVITWPTISWDSGTAPTLGNTLTVVTLLWTGSRWIGTKSVSV